MTVNICDSLWTEGFIPREALWVEGQATKNLRTSVELLHIRSRYHGGAAAVYGSVVVHAWTVARWWQHKNVWGLLYLKFTLSQFINHSGKAIGEPVFHIINILVTQRQSK